MVPGRWDVVGTSLTIFRSNPLGFWRSSFTFPSLRWMAGWSGVAAATMDVSYVLTGHGSNSSTGLASRHSGSSSNLAS